MEPAVSASYETCRRLHRRHDPTYYWAARRLPAEIRPALHALYGYVRTADEMVDGPRRAPTPDGRRAELDAWEAELDRGLAAGGSAHPGGGVLGGAGRAPSAAARRAQGLHGLDAPRLRPGSHPDVGRPLWVHGRLG